MFSCDYSHGRSFFKLPLNVLFAILAKPAIPVKSFTISLKNLSIIDVLSQANDCQKARFRQAWAHLEELRVVFPLGCEPGHRYVPTKMETDLPSYIFTDTPNLRSLEIEASGDESDTLLKPYVQARGAPLSLYALKLCIADVDSRTIGNLLHRCRYSLKKLIFHRVGISIEGHHGQWVRTLHKLSDDFEQLESLELKLCREHDVRSSHNDKDQLAVFDDLCEQIQIVDMPGDPLHICFHDQLSSTLQEKSLKSVRRFCPPATPNYINAWRTRIYTVPDYPNAGVHITHVQYSGTRMKEVLTILSQSIAYMEGFNRYV